MSFVLSSTEVYIVVAIPMLPTINDIPAILIKNPVSIPSIALNVFSISSGVSISKSIVFSVTLLDFISLFFIFSAVSLTSCPSFT